MYYANVIYHVYNQSINSERLFRSEANYLRFLKKVRVELLPVADLICYCLMPTHFHLQLVPKPAGLAWHTPIDAPDRQQVIHARFRNLLSSYTRILNRQYDRRGSLFRSKTKYKPAYADFIPDDWELLEDIPFTQLLPYVKTCFDYIHDNPGNAGMVRRSTEWPYSSAADYAGLRNGTLCNYELAERLIGVQRP